MASGKVKYLLIGGGTSSAQAAVGIRELDKEGSITIVGREPHIPYDRPPLSKGFLNFKPADPADIESKDSTWYPKNQVTVLSGTEATRVDRAAKVVTLSNGDTLEYEKLLIATGSSPRELKVPGMDFDNVFLFRTVDDSSTIRDLAKTANNVVLIGAGYIGMEIAASLNSSGKNVTVIGRSKHPWAHFASAITGNFLRSYFENKGVKFVLEDEVDEIVGEGRAETVRTKKLHSAPADLVIAGVGIQLNTALAQEAGLTVDPKQGVFANAELRSEDDENIWLAGDIANYEDRVMGGRWNKDHHMNAVWTGKQAGRNMAGAGEPFEKVPYFFSDQFDLQIVIRGNPHGGHSARIIGDVDTAEFVELYADANGQVQLGIGITRDGDRYGVLEEKLAEFVKDKRNVREISPDELGF
jgi:3-phenylpropionate/trans-cinnamate dioxygenase ferredoxin reductase subunit